MIAWRFIWGVKMKLLLLSAAVGALAYAALSNGVHAATIYTEDFNAAGFNGGTSVGSGDPVGIVTDRTGWAAPNTTFTTINSFDGWTFSGSTYYVTNGAGNGAVYLNETNGVALHLQNLATAQPYNVSFTYWGDNRPISYTGSQSASTYDLYVWLNGVVIDTITDYDREPGTSAGNLVTLLGLFADGSGNFNLQFTQGTNREASPILDDVTISDNISNQGVTPIPAALPLFATGLGGLGLLSWRRKRKAQAAA